VEQPSTLKVSSEQIEALRDIAEQLSRKFILSRASPNTVEELNVEVEVGLSKRFKDLDLQQLAKSAANEAMKVNKSAPRRLK
jgi:hypothetical protein